MLLLLPTGVLPVPVSAGVYGLASLICHQRPERSFHLAGAQLAVCARCLGIYAGVTAGAAATAIRLAPGAPAAAHRFERVSPRKMLLAVALPTALTLIAEWAGVWDPGNIGRALAGGVLGAGVAIVVLTLHYDQCVPPRPTAPRRPATHI
jgi:uncharacterized membrane protein